METTNQKFKVSKETLDDLLTLREVKDLLNAQPHPFIELDEAGYSFYDYVVYKRTRHKRHVNQVVESVDRVLNDGATITPRPISGG